MRRVKLGTHQYSGRLVALKVVDKRSTRKSIVIALKKGQSGAGVIAA
jgi:GTP-sensing pleiotropic transcriptional regulator CodY